MVEQFCKSILQTENGNGKALANLVMGLASHPFARSVVEISTSPCHHYQYSSISKAIDQMGHTGGGAKEPHKPPSKRKAGREGAEKNFVFKEGAFFKTLWKILVAEHGYQSGVPATFSDPAAQEVCAQAEQPGKGQ